VAVAFQTVSQNIGTTATPGGIKPTGTVDGDLLLMVVGIGSAQTITGVPAGWNPENEQVSGAVRTAIYSKIASGEPGSWTWTLSASSGCVIHGIRIDGHAPSGYINAIAGQANASSVNVIAPGVTPSVANCLLIFVGHISAASTFTAPGSMTEFSDQTFSTRTATEDWQLLAGGAGVGTGTRTAVSTVAGVSTGQLLAIMPPQPTSVSLLTASP
jgi:hypothetical protein